MEGEVATVKHKGVWGDGGPGIAAGNGEIDALAIVKSVYLALERDAPIRGVVLRDKWTMADVANHNACAQKIVEVDLTSDFYRTSFAKSVL